MLELVLFLETGVSSNMLLQALDEHLLEDVLSHQAVAHLLLVLLSSLKWYSAPMLLPSLMEAKSTCAPLPVRAGASRSEGMREWRQVLHPLCLCEAQYRTRQGCVTAL